MRVRPKPRPATRKRREFAWSFDHFSKDCRPSFFYRQAELLQGAADGGLRAVDAEAVAELLQGEVGLRCQELADLVVAFRADGRLVPPGVGPRPQRPGLFAQAQQVVDGIDGDAEAAGDLGGGAVAVSDGVEDAFPQGHWQGVHGKRLQRTGRGGWGAYNDYRTSIGFVNRSNLIEI